MPEKHAAVVWRGDSRQGRGEVTTPDSVLRQVPLSYPQRFEEAAGASPEELIAAAHAGCFSMALAAGLTRLGHPPGQLRTRATVSIEPRAGGWVITRSHLAVRGRVPGVDESAFQQAAREAELTCPVSKALQGNVEISVEAVLERTPAGAIA